MSHEVEVRIRHASDIKALPIFSVPLADVDGVIPTIRSWGFVDDNGEMYSDDDDFTGQFTSDGTSAYFEVIVDPE